MCEFLSENEQLKIFGGCEPPESVFIGDQIYMKGGAKTKAKTTQKKPKKTRSKSRNSKSRSKSKEPPEQKSKKRSVNKKK